MNRPFDPKFILEVVPQLLPYLGATFYIVIGAIIGGSILGALIAIGKMSRCKIIRIGADIYIYIVRSTPSIVLLFVVFYGLPELIWGIFGINFNTYNTRIFVLTTFIIIISANMAEIMRAAYLAVPHGQQEAAFSIGLSRWQAFWRIQFPQCILVALPNLGNTVIGLLKEGALAYTIGFVDIMGKGKLIIGNNYGAYGLETYIALAIIYWIITILIEKVISALEKYNSKGTKQNVNREGGSKWNLIRNL